MSAGWPERRRAHWTLLAQARAVENQAYVLACGTAGTHAGVPQAGHSVVVDPWGQILAEAGAGEEVLTVEFDAATVAGDPRAVPGAQGPAAGAGAASAVREPVSRPYRLPSPRSFSARWITHTATAMSSAGSASSRMTSTPYVSRTR